jgi:ubiquinone/menaquinone biosynthesis C-methylase UbiE
MHASFDDLKTYMRLVNKLGRVLIPGCGNSPFSEDLFNAGYQNQISMDFCPQVISQMQQRAPHLQFVVGDATNMSSFVDGYFETVAEKALLDTLSCREEDHEEAQTKFAKEVFRLLSPGGIFISVSIQNPETAMKPLQTVFGKNLTWYPLNNDSGASDVQRSVIICRKPADPVPTDSTIERIQQLISLSKTGKAESTIGRIREVARQKKLKNSRSTATAAALAADDSGDSDVTDDTDSHEDDDTDDSGDGYSITERYKIELRKLYRKEPEVCTPFWEPGFWQTLVAHSDEGKDERTTNRKAEESSMAMENKGPWVGIFENCYEHPLIVNTNSVNPESTLAADMNDLIRTRGFAFVKSVCGEDSGGGSSRNSKCKSESKSESTSSSTGGGNGSSSASPSGAPIHSLPTVEIDWATRRHLLKKVSDTIDTLKKKGWPPVFVFMFDEPWQIIDGLFELMQPVLGEDCVLDASVFAWGLDRGNREEHVGGNFKLPHRDATYSQVNGKDGNPVNLSVWMCINEVTLENGCMFVLPREADPAFADEESRYHMCAAVEPKDRDLGLELRFHLDHVLALPGPPGSVLCWCANAVHWGSSCGAFAKDPRKNIAMSFRVSPDKLPLTDEEISISGRAPLTREEVRKLSIKDRLSIVAKALIMYCHWFPDFGQFPPELLGVKGFD